MSHPNSGRKPAPQDYRTGYAFGVRAGKAGGTGCRSKRKFILVAGDFRNRPEAEVRPVTNSWIGTAGTL